MSIFGLSRINKRCHNINYESAQELLDNYFKKYNIALNVQGIENIPTSGRFILIANHPYGFLDGLAVLKMIIPRYPKVKITANFLLRNIPIFKPYTIPVNPFSEDKKMGGKEKVISCLSRNEPIIIFPAGEISTRHDGLHKPSRDKEWGSAIKNLLNSVEAPVVPIYFEGENSFFFHFMGKIKARIRTFLIPIEFLKIKNRTINLHVGQHLYKDIEKTSVDPQLVYNDFVRKIKSEQNL
tara:strand:+ start:1727 stop:2443 length:717 start_codon:yes stop_codon:yes gene_type:complete